MLEIKNKDYKIIESINSKKSPYLLDSNFNRFFSLINLKKNFFIKNEINIL